MLVRTLRKQKTWKHRRVRIPKKSVLIVDEAGMLDTRTLSRLLHQCRKSNATVILTGDTQQLPPILAGGPMDHVAKRIGEAKLVTNRRQQNPDDRDAVRKLREGKIEEAIKDYAKRERLTMADDPDHTKEKLVETWCQNKGFRQPAKHLILTQTREDAHDLNHRCQRERLKRGRSLPGLSIKHGQDRFYIGDRVTFHQPMRKHGIENGQGGTVLGVDPITRKVVVRLDRKPSKSQRKMGIRQVEKISLLGLDRDAVRLGYASTTHRAQGLTCDNAYVLLCGPMMSREVTYTQLTRAKKTTRLFVDKASAGPELEHLVKAISRSSGKDLAHDHQSEAKEEQKSTKTRARQQHSASLSHEIDRIAR